MSSNISDFINEYFRLTGRPISTMSVSEYIEFLSFVKERQSAYISSVEQDVKEPFLDKQPAEIIEMPEKENEDVNPEKEPDHESAILRLMQSISG